MLAWNLDSFIHQSGKKDGWQLALSRAMLHTQQSWLILCLFIALSAFKTILLYLHWHVLYSRLRATAVSSVPFLEHDIQDPIDAAIAGLLPWQAFILELRLLPGKCNLSSGVQWLHMVSRDLYTSLYNRKVSRSRKWKLHVVGFIKFLTHKRIHDDDSFLIAHIDFYGTYLFAETTVSLISSAIALKGP